MFRHHLDRPSDKKTGKTKIRLWEFEADLEDVFVFIHISLAFAFVVWGLELILPWTVWRILVGVYIALWVGGDLLKQLFGKGIYILTGGGGGEGN